MLSKKNLALGGVLIQPRVFSDTRGSFRELYKEKVYLDLGIDCAFVQDNHSFSHQNTLRGMHFQRTPGQAKLVSVLEGQIFDVIVDIRPGSNFGRWEGVYLDSIKGEQLFVPVGFAHGFCVMSPTAHVTYKVSSPYDPVEEFTFRFDDPEVGIQWPIPNPILSDRDHHSPYLKEIAFKESLR